MRPKLKYRELYLGGGGVRGSRPPPRGCAVSSRVIVWCASIGLGIRDRVQTLVGLPFAGSSK